MSFWDGIVCDLFLCLLRENEHTMTELYLNKYRIPPARAQWWNYADNASYFITICTANRQHYFGKIKNQNMELSDIGSFATKCWFEIPQHFPFVQLGAFIVMPNHVHGIVIIQKPENAVETLHATSSIREMLPISPTSSIREILPIPETSSIREMLPILPTMETLPIPKTLHATSLPAKTTIHEKREFMSKISPDVGAIPTVLRSFKSAVTRMANLNKTEFGWQTRFHDRIIRDEKEYQRINDYIETNPLNWQKDKFYCE